MAKRAADDCVAVDDTETKKARIEETTRPAGVALIMPLADVDGLMRADFLPDDTLFALSWTCKAAMRVIPTIKPVRACASALVRGHAKIFDWIRHSFLELLVDNTSHNIVKEETQDDDILNALFMRLVANRGRPYADYRHIWIQYNLRATMWRDAEVKACTTEIVNHAIFRDLARRHAPVEYIIGYTEHVKGKHVPLLTCLRLALEAGDTMHATMYFGALSTRMDLEEVDICMCLWSAAIGGIATLTFYWERLANDAWQYIEGEGTAWSLMVVQCVILYFNPYITLPGIHNAQ